MDPFVIKFPDTIKQMREIATLEEQLGSYFRVKSQLWRAIWEHIAHAKDCVLIKRQPCIAVHRGTGHSIHFTNAHLWAPDYNKNPPEEADVFEIEFYIDYYDNDREQEYMVKYNLNVPTALELNFTQKGFREWIAKMKEKRDIERNGEDLRSLKRLVKKFPKQAEALLE